MSVRSKQKEKGIEDRGLCLVRRGWGSKASNEARDKSKAYCHQYFCEGRSNEKNCWCCHRSLLVHVKEHQVAIPRLSYLSSFRPKSRREGVGRVSCGAKMVRLHVRLVAHAVQISWSGRVPCCPTGYSIGRDRGRRHNR
jgi:hypothetical protein